MLDADFEHWKRSMERMLPALLAFMNEPATLENFARFYRGLYNALIQQGFTPSEALAIAAAQRPSVQANSVG